MNDFETTVLKTVPSGNYKSNRVFSGKLLCQQKCMKSKTPNFPVTQREALLITFSSKRVLSAFPYVLKFLFIDLRERQREEKRETSLVPFIYSLIG